MIYAVKDRQQILFFEEYPEGRAVVEIDDEFENRFLYVYNPETNQIIKKTNISYIVEEIDGNAIIMFDTNKDLYLRVIYEKGLYRTENVGFAYANDGMAKLELELEVDGFVRIELISETHCIVPLTIEVEDAIDDDPLPTISLRSNRVMVAPHPYYTMIQELKADIKQILKGE